METGQDGWWLVRNGIQKGLAPSNYLFLISSVLPSLPCNIKGKINLFLY